MLSASAAIDTAGQIQPYSNYGTNILVSAGLRPLRRTSPAQMDIIRPPGRPATTHRPLAAPRQRRRSSRGVIALMLDANENLGWRDVREILATSATLTGSIVTGNQSYEISGTYIQANTGQGDTWNDGGRGYSLDYGSGNVNAYAAVRMAEVWSLFRPAQPRKTKRLILLESTHRSSVEYQWLVGRLSEVYNSRGGSRALESRILT